MTEFRPGGFQVLPTVVKNLIIINVLVYLVQISAEAKGINIDAIFALHTWQSPLFKPWQFVTHMFMHATGGNISHLLFNMLALWMFGSVLESLWGPKRFITFYLASGLGAAFCHMIVLYFQTNSMLNDYNHLGNSIEDAMWFINKYGQEPGRMPEQIVVLRLSEATLGASGAVFGCLAAFAYLFPNSYIYLYFFLPVKAKWFVLGYAAIELYMAIKSSAGDNVAHVAHLGGALVGLILVYFWNKTNRSRFY